jgi:pimeloyl-ACP methyl ester carboxylesterase
MGAVTLLDVHGVRIAASTFGSPDDPAVLLIAGGASSMDWWEPEFCAALARSSGGRYVIRYDHRDTGESVSYPPGRPGYASDDLTTDGLGVLDALGVERANVVGISMGGSIAQLLAIGSPSRVRTLTLISTSGSDDPDLPAGHVGPVAEPDWTDRAAVVEYLVEYQRVLASPKRPFDEAAVRAVARVAVERTASPESAERNHYSAEGGEESWGAKLASLTMPTLVLHGADDPMFPLPHGEALARAIPGARLVVLPDTGHEFPRENWPTVLRELAAHTR